MSILLSDCISISSFQRLNHKIFIRNETSRTQFIKNELIIIKELKDNGIVLEMPMNVSQRGHSLTLFFLASSTVPKIKLPSAGPYKEASFEIVARVDKIEGMDNFAKTIIADITFIQYDLKEWKDIIQKYSNTQDEINSIIMRQYDSVKTNE